MILHEKTVWIDTHNMEKDFLLTMLGCLYFSLPNKREYDNSFEEALTELTGFKHL